jgi:hypothetical protein
MSSRTFVVRCSQCGEFVAAADPMRCDLDFMGQMVRDAEECGYDVAFVSGAVKVTLGGCQCRKDGAK